MNRMEFIKELEYLLQDIEDGDKVDAIAYYRDYLEEAGDESEAEVLREFGSPERIAALIRSDLCGGMEQAGEFTDSGFQDSRFEDPRYQLAKPMDLPEVNGPYDGADKGRRAKPAGGKKAEWSRGMVVLVVVLAILASPMLLGLGGGLLGGVIGVVAAAASLLLVAAIMVAVLTFVFFSVAVGLIGFGIGNMFVAPAQGLLLLGVGIAFLGLGFLSLLVATLFYGRLLPAMLRGCVNFISRIIHKRKGRRTV